ncbi:MAG: hypothetical protein HYV27_17760 [Candidatus Hydrogenedentes bacterium]|nr:hypothetical protein [Candidatus Hydrogenedentota bacterium]
MPKAHRTLAQHVARGLQELHQWRPTSFYLLLATPLVLLLGAQLGRLRDNPGQFAFVLSLLFVFFAIVVLRALMDLLEIMRKRLREERDSFQQTLGDQGFVNALRSRQQNGAHTPKDE